MVDLAPKWAKESAILGLEMAFEQLSILSQLSGAGSPAKLDDFRSRISAIRESK